MILRFDEFLNESFEPSASFPVDSHGKVNVYGLKHDLFDIMEYYAPLVDYAFATFVDRPLMYYPSEKKFKEKKNGKWEYVDLDPKKVKFRSIKLQNEFVTGQELDSIMKTISKAFEYRKADDGYEILDHEGNVIRYYEIDPKTGKLK